MGVATYIYFEKIFITMFITMCLIWEVEYWTDLLRIFGKRKRCG